MGTTEDKLNAIASSKAAIKAAIQAKGVACNDVLSTYANCIAAIATTLQVPNAMHFAGDIPLGTFNKLDFSAITNANDLFAACNLTSEGAYSLNLPKVTTSKRTFSKASAQTLNVTLPADYDNGYTLMFGEFNGQTLNVTLTKNTNPQDLISTFENCTCVEISLTCSGNKIQKFTDTFKGCTVLTALHLETEIVADLNLSTCTRLTQASLVGVIAKLVSGAGKTLTLGETNLAKLTDEQKAVATAKGWTLA